MKQFIDIDNTLPNHVVMNIVKYYRLHFKKNNYQLHQELISKIKYKDVIQELKIIHNNY